MKTLFYLLFSIVFVLSVEAKDTFDGVNAIIERRKMQPAPVRPVRQITEKGSILSLYADGVVTTQAVRMIRMSAKTKAAVESKLSDEALLASAKSLARQIKAKHGNKVTGLSDADVIASAETVFDSTATTSTAALISALLGVGVMAVAKKKGKKS